MTQMTLKSMTQNLDKHDNVRLQSFGQDGTRLPDQRRRYNADLAQLRVQQSLEWRGRKAAKGAGETE